MLAQIKPAAIGGSVTVPPSKSAAHRALIAAALSDGECAVYCPSVSDDITATARSLSAFGADINYKDGTFFVSPIKNIPVSACADCGESGSTLRFLMPVAAALGINTVFKMSGRLPDRPMDPIVDLLRQNGVTVKRPEREKWQISGKLKSGEFCLPADISSQFISGMLFALPLSGGSLRLVGSSQSVGYVNMTVDTLKSFGVKCSFKDSVFTLPAQNRYVSPKKITVEGDWSNAAFFLVAGAFSESGITVCGLNAESLQGDREIINILRQLGAKVDIKGDSVTVKKGIFTRKPVSVNAENIPDIIPVTALAASVLAGETVIKNAGRLRLKECDRLSATAELLSALGADIKIKDDGFVINGSESGLNGGKANGCGDHRMVMTAAVAAAVCRLPVTVSTAEAVAKSYPNFFEVLRTVGAEVTFTKD